MNDSSQPRLGLGLVVVATVLLLVTQGCAMARPAADESTAESVDEDADAAAATASPSDDAMPAGVDLSFEAGPDLASTVATVGWADPFAGSDRFVVKSPDDGNGSWSYTDTGNQCTIGFFQGTVTDLTVGTDDRTTTDEWLLLMNQVSDPGLTPEIVAQYAEDAGVPLFEEEGDVDVRGFGGEFTDGSSWTEAARYFGALDFGLHVRVDCPAERSSFEEYDELLGEYIGVGVATVE